MFGTAYLRSKLVESTWVGAVEAVDRSSAEVEVEEEAEAEVQTRWHLKLPDRKHLCLVLLPLRRFDRPLSYHLGPCGRAHLFSWRAYPRSIPFP